MFDHRAVGQSSSPHERSWDSTQALLYALGVGAGAGELSLTTENTTGVDQQVLPTMGMVLGHMVPGWWKDLGEPDWTMLLHGEQALELRRPIPVEGSVRSVSTITGLYDKGSGALITVDTESVDTRTDELLLVVRTGVFVRGAGGFGGPRGPSGSRNRPPDRDPDHVVRYPTSPDQALLYRLSGDRNPLHSDPSFAARAGYERPILHGLCTCGFAGRALLHTLCGGDGARVQSMEVRFTAPVLPGDELIVSIWKVGDGEALFITEVGDSVVLDAGRFRFGP